MPLAHELVVNLNISFSSVWPLQNKLRRCGKLETLIAQHLRPQLSQANLPEAVQSA
jgi:hypothetical protein